VSLTYLKLMPRITSVAAIQAAPIAYDLAASLRKVASLTTEATAHGAQLVVFPEAFLSAYPRHLAFSVGSRTVEHRDWYARYVRVGTEAIATLDPSAGLS
jgi:nitrilase